MKQKNRLKAHRGFREITQMDLAVRLRMHPNRYWRIENGYTQPTETERAAMAKALQVPESELFPDPPAVRA